MQMRICRTGNLRDLSTKIARQPEVRFPVRTRDLNVDGSRKSKVENLVHNVRRLEEERRPRKLLGKNLSHLLHVSPGVTMFAASSEACSKEVSGRQEKESDNRVHSA